MATKKREVRGSIRGRPVELEVDPGLLDGSSVRVILETHPPSDEAGRIALLEAAGGWADDDVEGLDRYLEWNRQQRKVNRPEIE